MVGSQTKKQVPGASEGPARAKGHFWTDGYGHKPHSTPETLAEAARPPSWARDG